MLIEILKHTPPWVFVLFFVLLAAGYSQTKDRTLSRARVAVIPTAMIVLSFYGVVSAFALNPLGLVLWTTGVAAAMVPGLRLAARRGVTYSPEKKLFHVPGSWLPLTLMMIIFFLKYTVAVIVARGPAVAGDPAFTGIVSFIYGTLSGMFLARTVAIWRTAMRDNAAHQQ